ncbi:putative bifunctional diguanylate cyclase/phosphodiesterase [Neorhizobium sp. NPDC001467]|uniref:putative bifunctional diguanylate cyclase/phosphodiesterase n=1 Tax=Neorhizobium sp. NPDC001467 TaxID=3390595 RepID=UPI003CFF4A3C
MILELQNAILEMIARGETLEKTVDLLCREVEVIAPDIVCSVLSVENGLLHPLAGPSLPPPFSAAVDNQPIGPNAGSCGTAAYLGQPVVVTDIAADPRWRGFEALALPLGLVACWSSPIRVGTRVAATFAFYFREKRGPNALERQIVEACVHLCAIAIERNERVLERERLTYTDTLTDLPNRACFNKTLGGLANAPRGWGILLVDIDNLKLVNDTFGHAAGDGLIRTVASRAAQFGGADRTFRLGGDEFAIIVDRGMATGDDNPNLADLAARILSSLAAASNCAGHVVFPKATIGGALAGPGETADAVLQNADLALYHAKERSRGQYVQFSDGLGTAITRRFRAIRDVGLALAQARIHAWYQPIVRLDTREVVGFEALARMRTPSGDIVSAAHFHEATKDAQVAAELTQSMLEQVARDMRVWLDEGLALQHVGVNLSAADLAGGNLNERICTAFAQAGVPLKHVIVEVTESVYFGQGGFHIGDEIRKLRASGLRVALDDFGTGFASLTHLLTVPVDIIKIDKSFTDRLRPRDPAAVIIEGVVDIARKLGIRVVAEGIEENAQAVQLMDLGCALGQGYLFSKAVDRDAAALLLRHSAQRPANDTGAHQRA